MKTDKRSKVMGEILLPEYKTNARLVHGVMFFFFNFFPIKIGTLKRWTIH